MTIRIDILAAKAEHNDHVAAHKCRPAAMLTQADRDAGQRPCPERVRTWLHYMEVAGRWGRDPDDSARMTELYAGQTAELGQKGTTYAGMRRAA